MSERQGRAITVRLDGQLYEALQLAGELAGINTTTETLRHAAGLFIQQIAEDPEIVANIQRRQDALKDFVASVNQQ